MWTARRLPRLPKEYYRGFAYVFWTHTAKDRRTGWLDSCWHSRFREVLTHVGSRHGLACPAYVLMPDHLHLILIGCKESSDQQRATRLLREHLPTPWQKQPHDHLLREEERKRDRFQATCEYIWQNPVRAGLVKQADDWPYRGCLVPGYPTLAPHPRDRFWRCVEVFQNSLT